MYIYRGSFRELLSVDQDFNPLDLIDPLEKNDHGLIRSVWNRFTGQSDQQKIISLFHKKIIQWSIDLTKDLLTVRYDPLRLKALQDVVKRVFFEDKVNQLYRKLEKAQLINDEIDSAIRTLEEFIFKTLNTPRLGSLTMVPKNKYHQYHKKIGLECILSGEPLDCEEFNRIQLSKSKRLLHEKSSIEICRYKPDWGKEWRGRLLSFFKQIDDLEEVCVTSEHLETIQAIEIIKEILDDQKQEWKLIFLLGSLKPTTFVEILQSFDTGIISALNEVLCRSPEHTREWFQRVFIKQQEGIIQNCNRMKSKIDQLAKTFREDLEGHRLTNRHISKIYEMDDNIRLRLEGIIKKLRPLLEKVISHPETVHVLFAGVPKEYNLLLTRLREKREYDDRPAGCLWPIIYRNVFERGNHEDDDDAIEIFADWGVFQKYDYYRVGLLGDISEDEIENLSVNNHPNTFQIAVNNLEKLGVKLIKDWKEKNIFNRNMLELYLKKPAVSQKLTQWTREAF